MYSVFVFCVSQLFFCFLFFVLFSLSLVLYCIYCMHEYDALLYGGNKESIVMLENVRSVILHEMINYLLCIRGIMVAG